MAQFIKSFLLTICKKSLRQTILSTDRQTVDTLLRNA